MRRFRSPPAMYPVHARPCDDTTIESQRIGSFYGIKTGDTLIIIDRVSGMVCPRMMVVGSDIVVHEDRDGYDEAISFMVEGGYRYRVSRGGYTEIFVQPRAPREED